MNNKKFTVCLIIIGLLAAGIGFWRWSQRKAQAPEKEGSVETAKTLSEGVPEIQTNAGEKVPEINPVDRANPFKYTNPLR